MRLPIFLLLTLTISAPAQDGLTRGVNQLIVTIAKDWDSNKAQMWRFERKAKGWEAVSDQPVPVLLGRGGLAWGRAGFSVPPGGNFKREGDWRTPAGIFAVTKIYGYPEALPAGSDFPYREVGPYDAWIDDPKNPLYNQHYVATPGKEPSWFKSQRMRLGDSAYKYRVEIRHNSDPPVPGHGSAIFFHIRRGPDKPSAGCTTMAEGDLVRMIQWLRAKDNPHYVVLPKAEYDRLRAEWGLPEFR